MGSIRLHKAPQGSIRLYKAVKGAVRGYTRRPRPYNGHIRIYKAITGLERTGGGPRERYRRVLYQDSFKGLQGGGILQKLLQKGGWS